MELLSHVRVPEKHAEAFGRFCNDHNIKYHFYELMGKLCADVIGKPEDIDALGILLQDWENLKNDRKIINKIKKKFKIKNNVVQGKKKKKKTKGN